MSRIRRVSHSSSRASKAFFPAPLALAIALSVNAAHAATIVVDSADAASEGGKCTIVDAVAAVNTATAVNNCIAGDGNDDTIDLSAFTSPTTITFTSTGATQSHALELTSPVTISGPLDPTGTPLVTLTRSTVSGTAAFGIIHTTSPLTVIGLQITNGNAGLYRGGAILAGSTLTVTSSVISGNSSDSAGGGLAGTSSVYVQHSIVSGNTAGNAGGGIYAAGTVAVDYSTISGNSTQAATGSLTGGGGVFGRGHVGLLKADILNNTSGAEGGGVYSGLGLDAVESTISGNIAAGGPGGGLYQNPANTPVNLVVSRSTINGNTAQGNGGGVFGNAVGLENSTLTANVASGTGGAVQADALMTNYATIAQNQSTGAGGGVNFTSSAELDATIVAGNTSGTNTPDDVDGGAAVTGQFDIIRVSGVAVPADTLTCDPNLGALADNGGPTQTMALGSGSCAIDAADTTVTVATDQRGYTRPAGSGATPKADIGAYEAGATDPDVIFADGFGG